MKTVDSSWKMADRRKGTGDVIQIMQGETKKKTQPEEYPRFEELTRKLVRVPEKEIQEQAKKKTKGRHRRT